MVNIKRDYRSILREEFERRSKSNPSYSLRAFARNLGLTPNRVSEIFRHKQGLSPRTAAKVSKNLGLSQIEQEEFCSMIEAEHARSSVARKSARNRLDQMAARPETRIELNRFKVVADWYHFAILELTRSPTFRENHDWIARQLGITATQAELAMTRLFSLGLLRRTEGKIEPTGDFIASPSEIPSEAIRSYHRQHLEKAKEALNAQPVPMRDFSTINFLIAEEQIPEAKKLLKDFRRRFLNFIERKPKRTRLYSLSLQLYSIERHEK